MKIFKFLFDPVNYFFTKVLLFFIKKLLNKFLFNIICHHKNATNSQLTVLDGEQGSKKCPVDKSKQNGVCETVTNSIVTTVNNTNIAANSKSSNYRNFNSQNGLLKMKSVDSNSSIKYPNENGVDCSKQL